MAETPGEHAARIRNEVDGAFLDRAWDILWEVEMGLPNSKSRHTGSREGSDLWDATVQEVEERRAAGLPDQTRN